ncbi:Uncharacterized protein, UPF0548 family [Agrococcus baldri]|uniref:Uncharacterized protein, UPF0548 family n=1 Tax=Agrococcus baldri TaxID=153730 RepID=A0AA94HKS2_9MICO|nr:DUF1990 domain-containing protein [Agrococcus baldri]SFS00669.1 Uncharacterized protein, UPF0548 family [Agrococcus baldri]
MTDLRLPAWPLRNQGRLRRSEVSARIGSGDELWQRASCDLLHWRVKTRSGFSVGTTQPATAGMRLTVTARVAGLRIREPIEVVDVVQTTTRAGFSYRTLPGHPVAGEEAFILHRAGDDVVLTVRSLTQAASQQPWRALYPLLRIAQRVVRRRYLRALR